MLCQEDQRNMRSYPGCLLLAAAYATVACTPAAPPPAASPSTSVPVIRAEPLQATPLAPPRKAGPNRCLPQGRLALPKPVELHAPGRCVDHRRQEARIARDLKKEFTPTAKGSQVEVSFGCDPLTFDVHQIHLEIGYGHGGHLALWRLQREKDDDKEYQILGIVHRLTGGGYDKYTYEVASRFEARIGIGRVDAKAVAAALLKARPAMTARIRELQPPPSGGLSMSSFTSSGNFHHAIRILDSMPHVLEGRHTGYPSSGDQARYLGLVRAMGDLRPLIDKIDPQVVEPTPEQRKYFTERFVAASPRFEDEYAWWVRDRYVKLAGKLGGPELVPILVDVLRVRLAEVQKAKPEGGADRRLVDTVSALAGVTGWDARFNPDGSPRSPEKVAQEYIDECNTALHASSR